MNFFELHQQEKPLLLTNVWDVSSAKTAESLGCEAIGTSSMAIANMLGYEDGEKIPFDILFFIVKRIKAITSLPITVDIEAGYSRNNEQILSNIKKLVELGVVGINIEDSVVNSTRELVCYNKFSDLIANIKQQFSNQLFLNVRTDTYLLNVMDKQKQTLLRAKLYEQAGADGIFVPCLVNNDDIKILCQSTKLPVNVMSFPELADVSTLQKLGVKRISMGAFLFDKIQENLANVVGKIYKKQSIHELF